MANEREKQWCILLEAYSLKAHVQNTYSQRFFSIIIANISIVTPQKTCLTVKRYKHYHESANILVSKQIINQNLTEGNDC